MNTPVKTKKKQGFANQNPLEIVKGLGSSVASSFVDDLGKGGINDAWNDLLGIGDKEESQNKFSGDLSEGQELRLNKKDKKSEHNTAAPAIDYHREIAESGKIASNENQQVMQSQIQEILFELKKITEASAEMAMEFKEVTIEQRIENPGEYHVNFFQWMLSVVRAARAKIEDSGAWLNTMKSKKGQKNYWSMFKKHGTTFGLSNERVVATQAG